MKVRLGSAAVAAVLLAACGGGGSSGTASGTMTAACDWTAIASTTASQYRKCQQATGPSSDIQPELGSCVSGTGSVPAGVLRTTCPPAGGTGLVGCCSYPAFGLAMTWCYYDAVRYSTVEGSCHALTVDGEPAVWTTTVPIP
jgi:hypothetical protein